MCEVEKHLDSNSSGNGTEEDAGEEFGKLKVAGKGPYGESRVGKGTGKGGLKEKRMLGEFESYRGRERGPYEEKEVGKGTRK